MTVLREYETRELELTRAQAESLQRTGFVEVSPGSAGRWRVRASSFVGTLVVDGVRLLIRPKIAPENLFLLLEPGLPAQAWQQAAFEYDVSSDLLTSMVSFFVHTMESTLGRGVLRSYRSVYETSVALRGRLDIPGQLRTTGVLSPVACAYDDFTEDILENQVLRAAVRLASRVPGIKPYDRQRLLRQLSALDGVTDVHVTHETFDAIQINRLNRHYSEALRLADMLISNFSLTDSFGFTSASSFMIDMNDLFQRFVGERLRRELRHKLDVDVEHPIYLGIGNSVRMRPDLLFREVGKKNIVYVGDVKYKIASDGTGQSSDYYQLLAYTTALNLYSGILIYCKPTDSKADMSSVLVRNAVKKLVVRTIDLSGPPSNVESEISALASSIVDLSGEGTELDLNAVR